MSSKKPRTITEYANDLFEGFDLLVSMLGADLCFKTGYVMDKATKRKIVNKAIRKLKNEYLFLEERWERDSEFVEEAPNSAQTCARIDQNDDDE